MVRRGGGRGEQRQEEDEGKEGPEKKEIYHQVVVGSDLCVVAYPRFLWLQFFFLSSSLLCVSSSRFLIAPSPPLTSSLPQDLPCPSNPTTSLHRPGSLTTSNTLSLLLLPSFLSLFLLSLSSSSAKSSL